MSKRNPPKNQPPVPPPDIRIATPKEREILERAGWKRKGFDADFDWGDDVHGAHEVWEKQYYRIVLWENLRDPYCEASWLELQAVASVINQHSGT